MANELGLADIRFGVPVGINPVTQSQSRGVVRVVRTPKLRPGWGDDAQYRPRKRVGGAG